MRKIYLFEEKCCATSDADSLASFLSRKFEGRAEVRTFDLSQPTGLVPLPPKLFMKLQEQDSRVLPAMVVDSVVVTEGWLPNLMDAVELVESGAPAPAAMAPAPRPSAASSCCDPDGNCCE